MSGRGLQSKHRLIAAAGTLVVLWAVDAGAGRVFINEKFPIRGQKGSNLSPPHVEPTNQCATSVYVDSFVPHATIQVFLAGSTLIGGPIAPDFGFAAIHLTHALVAGDKITATQTVNGVVSAPSATMVVGQMPASLPAPTVGSDIYACGHVVPVNGLVSGVGVEVRDQTAGSTIGTGATPNDWGSDWDPVGTSALVAGHTIIARQYSCMGNSSQWSTPAVPVRPDPSPITAPVLDPPVVGNDAITASKLFTGALLQAFDHATGIGSGYATADTNWMHITPSLSASSVVTAKQSLCSTSQPSSPQQATSHLPAPQLVGPICPDESAAFVRGSTINATLVLLKNNVVVGYGGAAPGDVPLDLAPPASFNVNDKVRVAEYIGNIVAYSNTITVGACTDVTTYHNDPGRTGWNKSETTLSPLNVNTSSFGWITTVTLDDQVDTQPLVVTGAPVKGFGVQSVVYVTTESNTVYAIDSSTGTILRTTSLGAPVPTPLGCSNNGPNVGINGTGTIDLKSKTLYVISYELVAGVPTHKLHALDLVSLADRPGSPVTVNATQTLQGSGGPFTFNSTYQRQRPALLEKNGRVYAGFGSFCDFDGDKSRGWVLGWQSGSLAPLSASQLNNRLGPLPPATANVDCTWTGNHPCYLSSVWMSGYGLATDPSGNVYFVSGNSAAGTYGSSNISETAAKMSGDLSNVSDFFTPSDEQSLDSGDTDYGSGGLMVLPDQRGAFPHLAVAAGKEGKMFVLNLNPGAMGGFATPDKPSSVDVGESWCGPSYFSTSAANGGRVVSSGGNTVQLWSVGTTGSGATLRPTLNSLALAPPVANTSQDPGFFTSVSSNGTKNDSTIIWAVGRPSGNNNEITLYAYNGTPTGASLPLLWFGVAGAWNNTGGNANIVPTVANGRVFVASDQQLQIFGLRGRFHFRRLQNERPFLAAVTGQRREVGPAGARYSGIITKIEGDHLVLAVHGGFSLEVDITAAVKAHRASPAKVGQAVTVFGRRRPDGSLEAGEMIRAKAAPAWPSDRDK